MTTNTTAAQAAMQDPISEAISILTADAASIRESHTPPCDRDDWNSEPEAKAYYDRLLRVAGELSKLRAPKPLGDSCHHCGWLDWVSQDGAAYCQACGKPHGSVPAEGLPNLPQLLRENADLDEAEGGNAQVCALERDAADEIERLRREVAKLRAPVADERAKTALRTIAEYPVPEQDNMPARNMRAVAVAALASAPVAGEAQPSDKQIEDMADKHYYGGDFGRQPDTLDALGFTRELLAAYAAPQASEAVRDALEMQSSDERAISCAKCGEDHKVCGHQDTQRWVDLVWRIAKELNCLPSSFVDGNEHLVRAARSLQNSEAVLPAPCQDLRYHDQYRVGWNRCLDACRAALSAQPGAQKKGGSDAN